ncbi:MAG: glycosyltransferase family 2 protein [Solirubrobacteraceae bacterium]
MDAGRTLVIIPAYNESGHVGAVVRDVREHLPAADVLVIDDGSADDTAAEAFAAGATVVKLPMNAGYGAALQTGYKYGVREGYAWLAQIDADGQHRASYLPEMLAVLDDPSIDVVIGSRFLSRDGHYRPSAARKLGIALFSRVASVLTRAHVTDPTSGLQVLRPEVAEFFCTDVYPADYPDADMLVLLHRSGFRAKEVPVQMLHSDSESMHSGHRSPYYVYKMLLSLFVTILRPRRQEEL